eukprot:CAMPEP_0115871890 /NCGR_PEP_ID=MMETSP0287-20121206/23126_1 /TAXON_ID=412157 /ORGANISM="Chrysochromulina rotalis, Strain UIO044" /LENGTH=378 /DNA_ID=CAMNT_0003326759 /DNA_START=1 /DNA_END=1137 /DNA_ORIENTATION=+
MQGCKPAQATQSGAKLLATNDVDLRYQRIVRSVMLKLLEEDNPRKTPSTAGGFASRPLTGVASPDLEESREAVSAAPTPMGAMLPLSPVRKFGGFKGIAAQALAGAHFSPDGGSPTQLESEPDKPRVDWMRLASAAKSASAADLREAARMVHTELVATAGEDADVIVDNAEGDAALSLMAPFQWIAALVECSWACFPQLEGIEARLAACTDTILNVVLPLIDGVKQKRASLNSENVRALFAYFNKDLREIFRSYAAADQGAVVNDSASLESLNIAELAFMLKEGEVLDENLTIMKMKSIFAEANASAEEEGIDEDESEMTFEEFLPALALICDTKIPDHKRGGDAFEKTLYAWLQLQFIPTFRRLLKEKQRGQAKKTI